MPRRRRQLRLRRSAATRLSARRHTRAPLRARRLTLSLRTLRSRSDDTPSHHQDGLIEALVGVATGTLSPAAKLALVDSEATENGKEIFLTFPASVIDEYAACLRPLNEGDEIGLRWIDFRAMGGKLYGRYIQEPGYDGAAERAAIEELGAEIRAMGKTTRDVRVMNTLIGNPYMVNAFVRGSDNAFVPGLSLVSTADADVEEGEEEEGAASGVAPGFNAPPADAGEQS
jgi:hypothetical protein